MREVSSKKIPENGYAIIIGAMKCGTSSLYKYLIEHPNICPCKDKEPEYFSRNQAHGYKVDKYEDLWDFDPAVHQYALEASTGYTKYESEPDVPETIFKYGISPKFIYIVRNPFDRIISHYNHARYNYDIGSDWSIIGDDYFTNVSSYFMQLEQFRKYFPKEQFLIIDFDDVKSNPQKVLQKIYDFLKIPRNEAPREFSIHYKTETLSKFEMFLQRYSFLRKPYLIIPSRLRKLGKKKFKKYADPEEKRKLTDKEKNIIYKRLVNDMKQFREEYGFDVKKWGFNV